MTQYTAEGVERDAKDYAAMLGRDNAYPALLAIETKYGLIGATPPEVSAALIRFAERLRFVERGDNPRPVCIGCERHPAQIAEYVTEARETATDPDRFVAMYEGSFNVANGHFACTECYIKMGCPTEPDLWVAP